MLPLSECGLGVEFYFPISLLYTLLELLTYNLLRAAGMDVLMVEVIQCILMAAHCRGDNRGKESSA